MRDEAIPDLIRRAGDEAVAAYRSYFETGGRRNTRRNYAYLASRFFRWVAARGMALEAIDARSLAARTNAGAASADAQGGFAAVI